MPVPSPLFGCGLLLAAAGFVSCDAPALLAQDQTISGNLGVSGALDVSGDFINLGTWANDATKPGVSVTYSEDANHAASVTLTTTRPVSGWLWQEAAAAASTTSVPQMRLSAGNALTLYDQAVPTPRAAIVLNPGAGSSFATSVSMNGPDNQMPSQSITGVNSVLTVALADNRYVTLGTGASLSLGFSADASGLQSTALGAYSTASGNEATALSFGSVASGAYAVALGEGSAATGQQATALGANSAASGQYAQTLGFGSLASGWGTCAIGTGSSATGTVAASLGAFSAASADYSVTLGSGSIADGTHSEALGVYSAAHADSSMALGFRSVAGGSLSSALGAYSVVNSPCAVALGYGSTVTGYGATALGNGSRATGDYSGSIGLTNASSLCQFVTGNYNVLGGNPSAWVPTDDLFTVGNGSGEQARSNAFSVKKNGDTTVAGALTVAKAIIIQPQGDLSMGEFTTQPSPAP